MHAKPNRVPKRAGYRTDLADDWVAVHEQAQWCLMSICPRE
ncbi:MAG: hypothetical protein QG597_1506 [Actinomycetota bacterium]|nr:hypothetical protein [Actinomycetota bacterium]